MRRMMLGSTVIAVLGCVEPAPQAAATVAMKESGEAVTTFAAYDAGGVAGGPGPGTRFGLGRRVSEREVAAWNFDVGPDGAELPRGSGTAGSGATLYAAKCAMCHGARGEGIAPAFPALIGRDTAAEGFRFAGNPKLVKTIGNYWPNATTVFDYIKRAMPLTQPGSLSDDEVYALTAYLLAANDVLPDTARLDAAGLKRVKMPYADKFVPDTRTGGSEIR